MTHQPQPGDRARALALLEAAEFMRDAHFRDGLTVQEITTALAHTVDRADAMVGSLSRDGFGAEEIAEMLSAEPAAVSAAVAPPTNQAADEAVTRALGVLRVWRDEREIGPEAARLLYEVGAALTDGDAELRRMADETATEHRCVCSHPADEHSVYGCADDCACEWVPKRKPAAGARQNGTQP